MADSVPGWTTALTDRYRVERELGREIRLAARLAPDRSGMKPLRGNPRFEKLIGTS